MEPFEIVLSCSALGAVIVWIFSLYKVKKMKHSLDKAVCKIAKRTTALHNLEKFMEHSVLVFSQLEVFADKTLDGLVIVKDADKKESQFVYANPAMSNMLGWSQDELISCPWRDFLVDDDDHENIEKVTQALSNGKEVRRLMGEYQCKDGETKILSVSSCPADEEGYIYAVFREIS